MASFGLMKLSRREIERFAPRNAEARGATPTRSGDGGVMSSTVVERLGGVCLQ